MEFEYGNYCWELHMRVGIRRIEFEYNGQDAWVEFRKPSAKALLDFSQQMTDADEETAVKIAHKFLNDIIIAWNFEDTRGHDLKVNKKNIQALPADLFVIIIKRIKEVLTEIPLALKNNSTAQS